MLNFIADQDIVIPVLFVDGSDTVIPDAPGITYDLMDNGGSVIASAVAVSATTTQVDIEIDSNLNQKASGKDFELRTLIVNYRVDGKLVQQQFIYRLTDFVSLTANADGCRSLLGLSRDELKDTDVDILAAYWTVRDDITEPVMTAALTAGNVTTVNVNRMIVVQSLLDILGSIELRTKQMDKSNTTQVARFSKVDFASLRQWLTNLYTSTKNTLVVVDDSGIGAGLVMIATSRTTDPVTGQAPE